MSLFFINTVWAATEAVAENQATQQGLLSVLGIDWKLLIAQIINFAIVLLVLWHWVYKPLIKVLSERTKKIEISLKNAGEIETRLTQVKIEQEKILIAARQEADTIIAEAQKNALIEQQKIADETREQIEKQLSTAKDKLKQEKEQILFDIKKTVADLIEAGVAKILTEDVKVRVGKKIIKNNLDIN